MLIETQSLKPIYTNLFTTEFLINEELHLNVDILNKQIKLINHNHSIFNLNIINQQIEPLGILTIMIMKQINFNVKINILDNANNIIANILYKECTPLSLKLDDNLTFDYETTNIMNGCTFYYNVSEI